MILETSTLHENKIQLVFAIYAVCPVHEEGVRNWMATTPSGDCCAAATPRGPDPLSLKLACPASSQSSQFFPATAQGTPGRQGELTRVGVTTLEGGRSCRSPEPLRACFPPSPWSPQPPPPRPPSTRSNKGWPGKAKAWGGAARDGKGGLGSEQLQLPPKVPRGA